MLGKAEEQKGEEDDDNNNINILYFFLAIWRPYFIHNNTLTVNPSKNPATHWSGCSPRNCLVTIGPRQNVRKE